MPDPSSGWCLLNVRPAESQVIVLPPVRRLLSHASRHVTEAVIVPVVAFYLLFTAWGLTWALAASLAWSYGAIGRRLVAGQRVPAILVLGTTLFTIRCVIALATDSVFLYFLQPTLGTFVVASLFLVSVPLGRPLTEKLAHDFCPLPDGLVRRPVVRRFFVRLSLMWALVYLVNASATLFLLLTQTTGRFLVLRSFSPLLTGTAITVSYLWFRRSMRNENLVLRWASGGGVESGRGEQGEQRDGVGGLAAR